MSLRRGLPAEVQQRLRETTKMRASKEHKDMMADVHERLKEIRRTGNNNKFIKK